MQYHQPPRPRPRPPQPSSLLAAATRARHLLTLSWLTSGPAGGGGGPWAHALSAISPRGHGGEALLVAVAECRCPHLAACLLEAGVSARARDNEALIAACRQPGPGPAAPGGGGCDSGADGAGCDVEEEGQDRDRDPQLALVRLLLEHGADPRARGSLALTEAVRWVHGGGEGLRGASGGRGVRSQAAMCTGPHRHGSRGCPALTWAPAAAHTTARAQWQVWQCGVGAAAAGGGR